MIKIYTNTVTGKSYDANGDLFEDGLPTIFYKSQEKVFWQLCTETPDFAEGSDQTPETFWTKDTSYSQYTAVGAFLTADSDYVKRLPGSLASGISAGTVTSISATIEGADFDTIPPTGVVELFASDGSSEIVKYASRTIEDGTVTFTAVSGSSVEKAYDSGSAMDCSQEALMQASLDTLNSDVSTGLFAFKITAFSRKLHDLVAYSDVKSVDVMGLELALFRIDSDTNAVVDLERFEVDTFQIRTGMAETSANPPVTDPEANEIVTLCNTLLAAGFSLQFSSDNTNWHDTQVTTGETIDVFFRFRSAGSGGTWSNGIRLVKGDKGDDGASAYCYVAFASDDEGSDFSLGEPAASSQYVAFLSTDTAIASPAATDFAGLWTLYKGPQGNPGAAGQRGTRTNFGTSVTGTSTTPAVFPTGITDSLAGDLYLNTSTFNLYLCAVGGDASTATWGYLGSLKGPTGDSRYVYQGFASNSSGANFSTTPSASLPYTAFIITSTALNPPTSSDFSGATWLKYLGSDGTSSYTYVAYASDSNGSNFSNTPSDSLKYRAEIHVSSPITTPTSSNFSGATWVKYLGDPGSNGTRGSRFNYGTSITGTSDTPTAYATGISDSLANDAYVNTDTQNLYRCTLGGDASTALWVFVGSMKGTPAEAALEGVKLNGKTLTPTDKVVDVEAVPMTTSDPASGDQDVALYVGSDSEGLKKGHLYEKGTSYSDASVTISWSDTSKTLPKGTGNTWTDGDHYSLYYDNGHWLFTASGPYFTSPAVANTVMPWDSSISGQSWTNNLGGTTVITVERAATTTLDDITPAADVQLNGKNLAPSDGKVNVTALPIATSMPTANADAQPFILYLGATGGGFSKAHLYELAEIVDDSSIKVEISGLEIIMTGGSGSWTNQEVSPPMSLYYSSNAGAWILERGFSYTSPQCPSTTMPWDPAVSGKTWNYLEYGSITPTFEDPSVFSWHDLGSILGS